jgi:hypothetical protein
MADRLADTAERRTVGGYEPKDFGPAFGFDFRRVQVHHDAEADTFARGLGARAATVGQHIFFARGQYAPNTPAGRRLLLHELAHVTQYRKGAPVRIRRHCDQLLRNPGVNILGGIAVHAAIEQDFSQKVSGAVRLRIPGASARPQRTGRDSTVIPPQVIGGQAGTGWPDLGRLANRDYAIAEIKPALWTEVVDGEIQLRRYLDQARDQDPQQQAWRTSQGISTVSTLNQNIYPAPTLSTPNVTIRTCWFQPGLLLYGTYLRNPRPLRVRQPHASDQRSRERSRQQQPTGQPLPQPAAARSMSDQILDALVGVGISVAAARVLVPLVIAALADPEPTSKLAGLVGLTAATAILILLSQGDGAQPSATQRQPTGT